MKSQNVSWEQIENLVSALCQKILKLDKNFDCIYTVSRGGLIPSRLVADHLNIKKIYVNKSEIPSDSLFVDDIYDSGSTFNDVKSKIQKPSNFIFATLFARKGKKYPSQLIFASITESNDYVVFPWDRFEFRDSKKLLHT